MSDSPAADAFGKALSKLKKQGSASDNDGDPGDPQKWVPPHSDRGPSKRPPLIPKAEGALSDRDEGASHERDDELSL